MPALAERVLAAAVAAGQTRAPAGEVDPTPPPSTAELLSEDEAPWLNDDDSSEQPESEAADPPLQHPPDAAVADTATARAVEEQAAAPATRAAVRRGWAAGGGVAVEAARERAALGEMMRHRPATGGGATSVGPAGWGECLEAETVVSIEACGGEEGLQHRLYVHTTPGSMRLATVVLPED